MQQQFARAATGDVGAAFVGEDQPAQSIPYRQRPEDCDSENRQQYQCFVISQRAVGKACSPIHTCSIRADRPIGTPSRPLRPSPRRQAK
jgi:hypothetical protein